MDSNLHNLENGLSDRQLYFFMAGTTYWGILKILFGDKSAEKCF